MHQRMAAVSDDGLARTSLELANGFDDVVANDRGVAPDRFFQGLGDDILCRSVHHVSKRVSRWHRLESVGKLYICLSPQQESVDVLHESAEGGADVVMPIRHGPPAMLEPTFGVLLRTARG